MDNFSHVVLFGGFPKWAHRGLIVSTKMVLYNELILWIANEPTMSPPLGETCTTWAIVDIPWIAKSIKCIPRNGPVVGAGEPLLVEYLPGESDSVILWCRTSSIYTTGFKICGPKQLKWDSGLLQN